MLYLLEKLFSLLFFIISFIEFFKYFKSKPPNIPILGRYIEISAPSLTDTLKIPVGDYFKLTDKTIKKLCNHKTFSLFPQTIVTFTVMNNCSLSIHVKRGRIRVEKNLYTRGDRFTIPAASHITIEGLNDVSFRYIAYET